MSDVCAGTRGAPRCLSGLVLARRKTAQRRSHGHRVAEVRAFAERSFPNTSEMLLRADVDDQTIRDAELAMIALLDESAQQSSAHDCSEAWARRLLQVDHFNHSNLGRDFSIDWMLRQRPETPIALLELYARCLSFGFEGRFREDRRLDDSRAQRCASIRAVPSGIENCRLSAAERACRTATPTASVCRQVCARTGRGVDTVCRYALTLTLYIVPIGQRSLCKDPGSRKTRRTPRE